MNEKDKEILLKIIKHAKSVSSFAEECADIESFLSNDLIKSATAFELLQIGELAHTKLSDECKNSLNSIPWNAIYGLRNRIVHGYDDVDNIMVWETVKNDVPVLIEDLQTELEKDAPRKSIKEQLKEAEDKAKEHNAKLEKIPKKDKGLSR